MEFSTDIDKMFQEAAGAAEETGEKDLGSYTQSPQKYTDTSNSFAKSPEAVSKTEPAKKEEPAKQSATVKQPEPNKQAESPQRKQEPKPEPRPEPRPEPKVEQKSVERKSEQPKQEERKSNVHGGIISSPKGISEDSIGRILGMNKVFEKFDETQKDFVSGYFQLDEGEIDVSKLIYRALIASQRDIDALSKIVEAKAYQAAERAFFLMGLDNTTIEDIYEQVDLLTGELGDSGKVTESNKLNLCRKIESVIAAMPKDVFTYIEKLQQFTNKAVE